MPGDAPKQPRPPARRRQAAGPSLPAEARNPGGNIEGWRGDREARREPLVPEAEQELDRLKEEVAEDVGLDDDIRRRGGENLKAREAGKIGGEMVRRMVRRAEEDMADRDR